MANFILGKNGKLYVNDTLFSATNATPSALNTANAFDEYTNCRDVTISTDTEEVDITTRATSGFKATVATLKDSTIEFEAIWKTGDAGFDIIRTAWENSSEIAVMAMDGAYATSGNSGLIGNFTVPGFSREEPIGDVMRVRVTLKGSSRIEWYTAA